MLQQLHFFLLRTLLMQVTRRTAFYSIVFATIIFLFGFTATAFANEDGELANGEARPNILWLTVEDPLKYLRGRVTKPSRWTEFRGSLLWIYFHGISSYP